MQELLGVLNTDSVNRYGGRFTPGSLVSVLWEQHNTGMPALMSHDLLRPIGWTYPLAVYFEPGLTSLASVALLAETRLETGRLGNALQSHIVESAKAYEPEIQQLKALLAANVKGNEKVLFTKESLALVEEGLCERVFSHLFRHDDGLVALGELTPIGPGVYRVGELTVFAHHFFRRSLFRMNTLNAPFLKRLQEAKLASSTIRIAIDRDMVGLASTYREYQELEYWWGPKFSDDLASIPSGVAHHEASQIDRMFHGISGTQFRWQSRDEQHILEAEELRDIPAHFSDIIKYGCRYVHSIVDESTGRAFHFDGAIRAYSEEAMIERLSVDLARAGRYTEYTKLWRIDGEIPIHLWKTLLSDYFRDNRLVGEYLGAESDDLAGPSAEVTEDPDPVSKYVPYSMQAGAGVRIALSFHPDDNPITSERAVLPLDSLLIGESRSSYFETSVVELAKAISRSGASLKIPSDSLLIRRRDEYANLPVITHRIEGVSENIQKTLAGIRLLIGAFNRRGYDLILSYTLAFPVDGKEVRLSLLGHVVDLAIWLSNPLCAPPTDWQELVTWGDKVADYLKHTFPISNHNPSLFETLMTSGILLIRRRQVEERFNFKYEHTEHGMRYGLQVPDEEMRLKEALVRGDISPAMAFVLVASRCTHCGQEYRVCSCSKILDEGVAEEITEVRPLPAFWTDRPIR